MGHAILASQSEIRLSGMHPPDHHLDSAIKRHVRDKLNPDGLSKMVHVGYAKVETDGTITVELFPQYQTRSAQYP